MQNQNSRFDQSRSKNNKNNKPRGERRPPRQERPEPVNTKLQQKLVDFFQNQIDEFYPRWDDFHGQVIDADAFRAECRKVLRLPDYPTRFEDEETGEVTIMRTVEQQLRMDRETGDLQRVSVTCVGTDENGEFNYHIVAYMTPAAEAITVTPLKVETKGPDSYNRLHSGAKH